MSGMSEQTLEELILEVMRSFKYDHLPQKMQDTSRPFCELAQTVLQGRASFQRLMALQKLLEAKDAAVRASL